MGEDEDDAETYFNSIIEECTPENKIEEEKPNFWKMVSQRVAEPPPPKEEKEDKVGLFFKDLTKRFNANKEQQNLEKLNNIEPSNEDDKGSQRQKATTTAEKQTKCFLEKPSQGNQ